MNKPAKARKFFFYYNKPASQKAGTPKLSVHYDNACHIVDNVDCMTMCHTEHRKRQPRCVMTGITRLVDFYTGSDDKVTARIY